MWIRRIVLAGSIVAAGVFASFFGGAARTFFYLTLLVPFFSLLYTFYVYLRFCIYQDAACKVIVKGEKAPYFFVLADEDFIAYTDIRVEFLETLSTPQNLSLCRSYCLTPGEKNEYHTEIQCHYRGEYNIGVRRVIVTDLLGILQIGYPAPSTISMSVLPKNTVLSQLTLAPLDDDAKLLRFSHTAGADPPDCEMRKYTEGDSLRRINWKVSAKKRELFVRQSSDAQNNGILFVMDLSQIHATDNDRIITEDKILECALAIADYLVKRQVALTMLYAQDVVTRDYIDSPGRFKQFYGKCASIKFCSPHAPAALCAAMPELVHNGGFVIFAVSSLDETLCDICAGIVRLDGDVAVLLVGDSGLELSETLDRRVIFKHISLSDEIAVVLGGADAYEKNSGG